MRRSLVRVPRRGALAPGGHLLVVADAGHAVEGWRRCWPRAAPAEVTAAVADDVQRAAIQAPWAPPTGCPPLFPNSSALPAQSFDDIVYFGADADRIEQLQGLLAPRGVLDLVLGGTWIGRAVAVDVAGPATTSRAGLARWARRPSMATRSRRTMASFGPATASR